MIKAIAFIILSTTICTAIGYGWNSKPPKPEPSGKSDDFILFN